MSSCVIKMCRNYFKREKDKDNISFHRFPAGPIVANYWIKVIRESQDDHHWNPNKSSLVCSSHYEEKEIYISEKGFKRIKKGAVPSKFPCGVGTYNRVPFRLILTHLTCLFDIHNSCHAHSSVLKLRS
ncbi:hypothetical protein K1T71_008614 [Dendrolimus kikuchii]|uniref:Uncharacterized protein n=1 Tax=Dendrolimus kikuchii TaxID=765133 RepID=A0ACC1CV15_9NEOP|nr:hypothetical protein K1T71_008614 [Dendrolimus kikuchii]